MNRELESKRLLKLLGRRRMPPLKTIDDVRKFVTKFMMKQYSLKRERDINYGYCFIWAYLVWALMKEPIEFVTTDGHVVVKYNNKYFDSETSWAESLNEIGLPYYESVSVGIRGMAWYWVRRGWHKDKFLRIIRATYAPLYDYVVIGKMSNEITVDNIPELV